MASSTLRDRRILVVEDEYLIATTLSDQLEGAGSIVVGPVASVETAIKAIESNPEIDAAVLDFNLGGRWPILSLTRFWRVTFPSSLRLAMRTAPFAIDIPRSGIVPNRISSLKWSER